TPTSVSMLCVLSPCLYPHRPPSPTRRSSDLPVDPAEQEELPLAIHAAAHVAEQRWIVAIVEHVRQPPQRFLVGHGASSPSSVASRLSPRRFQLLTEPSGTPSRFAIALSLRSPRYARSSTSRSRSDNRAIAASSHNASTSS